MNFKFDSAEQAAAYLEETARRIRSRVPNASKPSQSIMRAEAHAYEQSAMIIRNSNLTASA